ncbi:MAG: phosphate transport regulator [Thaumarchaeota archaeon RBG_16_49_8]|nr:MAG: phosphate transport regulator [Thaumarchaeota archaeon RBG_16_49_8]
MYSGEAEIQARRRTLAVLQDEARRVLDAARDLAQAYNSLVNGDKEGLQSAIERVRKAEDDTESLRRTLTRELAEIGTMMMNREDLLRTAYDVEAIAGYISGIAFRFTQLSVDVLKRNSLDADCKDLIDTAIQSVQQLNQVVHALSVNPMSAIDSASQLQKTEKDIDNKYRVLVSKIFEEVDSVKDMIVFKDIVEGIEDLADHCLAAADSMTIVALGL